MRVKWVVGMVLVLYGLAVHGALAAATPSDVVRTGIDRVLAAVGAQTGDLKERRQAVRNVASQYLDFDEMAKRSLGAYWNQQPPEKKQSFISLFSQCLFNEYIRKIEDVDAGRIHLTGQDIQGDFAKVTSLMVVDEKQGDQYRIEYRLHQKDGEWKVYDISVEGVSLINNYRSQFGSILSKSSFDALLNQLKEKIAQQQS